MSVDLYLDNGTWCHSAADLKFCLANKPSETDIKQLECLVVRIQRIVSAAEAYARNSTYLSDIENCGGMNASTVAILKDWQFIVWFQLQDSSRFVGVRFSDDEPVDVYCDHP